MIIIVSQVGDASTNNVIDWLAHYDEKFVRINREALLAVDRPNFKIEIDSSNNQCYTNYDYSEIERPKSVWFRYFIYSYLPKNILEDIKNKDLSIALRDSFYYEYQNISTSFYYSLSKDAKTLGCFQKWKLNKLEILNSAKQRGIDIPATLITNNKTDVEEFLKKRGSIITKALSEVASLVMSCNEETSVYLNYTEEITKESLAELPDNFFYSLFQEKVDKDIEIRSFFLTGDIYSMAIFSQMEEKTSTDFRKYSNNRSVPYKLPFELEMRICDLMNDIGLDSGSIDLIKTKDGKYVFLEVNPTGQYGMTSNPCNYHLDKILAEHLIGK